MSDEKEFKLTKRVSILKGDAADTDEFVGLEGELTYNRTTRSVHVHDGEEKGGYALARSDHKHTDIPTTPIPLPEDSGKILQATNTKGVYSLVDPASLTFSTTVDMVTGLGVFGKKLAKSITQSDERTLLGVVDAQDPTASFTAVGKSIVQAETAADVRTIIDLSSALSGSRIIWIPGNALFDPSPRQISTWDDALVSGSQFSGLTLDPTLEQCVAFDIILPASWDQKDFSVEALWVSKTLVAGNVLLKCQIIGYCDAGSEIVYVSEQPKKEVIPTVKYGIKKTSFAIAVADTDIWQRNTIIRIQIIRAGDDVEDTYPDDILVRGLSIKYQAKELSE